MNIRKENNKISINGKTLQFNNNIDTILEFPECCIVFLMDDDILENNVLKIDYNGNEKWNISQIIKFEYPESYISLSKENENLFSVVTYNGVKFTIDVITNKIINKKITK